MIEFLDDIEEHFKKWYPKEGCGLLGVVKGKLKWFPCTNIADNDDDFILDSKEFIDISHRSDIVAVVHSHPNSSPEPSKSDINYCNATNLVYYIFSYPSMEQYTLKPIKNKKSLYGREYKFGVNDCYEAIKDYYNSISIPIRDRALFEDNWWNRSLDYFTEEYIATWNFKKVADLQENDFLVFNIHSNIGNHCGVYLGNDIFYHHAENRLSCRENLYPFWKKYITGVYRYES